MLEIRCFNGFEVIVDQQPLDRFYSQKCRALLVYLAMSAGKAQSRTHLAGLLWPDYPENRARRNLTQTLAALRRDLGSSAELIAANNQAIELQDLNLLSVDVHHFSEQLEAIRLNCHDGPTVSPACFERLRDAATLYTGPFLDQFDTGDSTLFESWVSTERERLLQQAIRLFTQLSQAQASNGNLEAALDVVEQLLALTPWQESAHRQKMLLLARQGQRIEALAQYDILCDTLMAELGVSPAAETDELYDQILAGEIDVATQGQPGVVERDVSAPFLAPTVSPNFVGRDDELAHIERLITENNEVRRPIALVGMGGIGKTAFATQIAEQFRSRFADGVLWANSSNSDPHNILDVWARAFGHDFSSINDLESKALAVRDLLAPKQLLIVIDNVADAGIVRPLLPNSANSLLLLTTRSLDVATALDSHPVVLSELDVETSMQLLVRILGDERVNIEREAAEQICHLLHYLPLAVEIAAKRLQSRPRMRLAALAARLESTQQRLGLTISDQAVRTSFQVSWEGLDAVGRELFAAVGLFSGRSFQAEAAAALSELDLFDTEDELYTLVALSLANEVGDTRYRQHPLLADFALEQLQAKLDEAKIRLADYYLEFAQNHANDAALLKLEWDNIGTAIVAAYDLERWQLVLDFTDALASSWMHFSRFRDAARAYHLAVETAKAIGSEPFLAKTLLRWAEINIELSQYEMAWEQLEQANALFEKLADNRGLAKSLYFQAFILHDQSEFARSEGLALKSHALEMALADPRNQASTLILLGWIYFQVESDTVKAKAFAEQASNLLVGTPPGIHSLPLFNLLATIEMRNANPQEAERFALQSLALSEQLDIPAEIAFAQQILVAAYRMQHKYEQAEKFAFQSLQLNRSVGNKRFEGMVLIEFALVKIETGELHQAKRMVEQSKSISLQLDDQLGYGYALRQLGDVNVLLGNSAAARLAWEEAREVAIALDHPFLQQSMEQKLQGLN